MGTFLRLLGISSDDNRIDQATGLTEKQKKLVQSTWSVIRKDEVGSGILVMTTFLKKYPAYQQHFAAFKDIPLDELPDNKRFQAHCASVITALNNVIDSLHDPGLMEASLIGLAERHKKRGQTKEEFQLGFKEEEVYDKVMKIYESAFGRSFKRSEDKSDDSVRKTKI